MTREYYILSLKHTHHIDHLIWWRPENSDYTVSLDNAGKYSHEDVIKHASYYNNHKTTLAIPCEEVEPFARRVVSIDHINKLTGDEIFYQSEDGLKNQEEYDGWVKRKQEWKRECERLYGSNDEEA